MIFFLKLLYFNINNFQINDLILAHYGQNEVRAVKIFRELRPQTPANLGAKGASPPNSQEKVSPRIFIKRL